MEIDTEKEVIEFADKYDLAMWYILVGKRKGIEFDKVAVHFNEKQIDLISEISDYHEMIYKLATIETRYFELLKEIF